jgi:hypothetical protein
VTCTFADWTQPYSYCGAFTYTSLEVSPNAGALPACITFTPGTRTFSIYTTNSNNIDNNVYTVSVTGDLNGHESATITF